LKASIGQSGAAEPIGRRACAMALNIAPTSAVHCTPVALWDCSH
jgi:hypothetical protein